MTILDPQSGENKKKSLALKASSQEEEDSDENNDDEEFEDEDEESEDKDEEFEFLLKEFNKFAQRKFKNLKKKSKPPKCYECANLGISNQIVERIKRRRNIKHMFHGKTKTIHPPPPTKMKTPTFFS
ncbi:hypothetical protein PIB30_057813 [Stylosanthes scabra]|uniref:Uncharacterized protein n=1 Tax=Stylosanthes scabra TaxID=79078 RepID=A0ABU6ZIF8_9FABA|nr:hypothetical protein [Stylosanthes scabra]